MPSDEKKIETLEEDDPWALVDPPNDGKQWRGKDNKYHSYIVHLSNYILVYFLIPLQINLVLRRL